ncbi:MAG: hypothetical protein HYT37_04015 [Candidatus Sungbacteria bacterium]|nr:hypothetical protein [Candidatus Sungbacteria bacterium]
MDVVKKVYEYLTSTGEPVRELAKGDINTIDQVCEKVLGCLWDSLTPHEKGLMCGAMKGDWGIKPEREDLLLSWDVRWKGDHIDIMIDPPSPISYWGKYKVVCSRQIVRACKEANSLVPAADYKIKRLGITLRELAIRCGVAAE